MAMITLSFLLLVLGPSYVGAASCASAEKPDNGKVNIVGDGHVRYECDYGYILSGKNESFCQTDGTWTYSTPKCDIVECPAITALVNGKISPSNPERVFGTKVTYECNMDYGLRPRGVSPEVTCGSSGQWEPALPTSCEEISCAIPKKPNLIVEEEYDSRLPGGLITFSCDKSWQVLTPGTTEATCLDSEQWDPQPPNCTDCPDPKPPIDGLIEVKMPSVTYTCEEPFILEGSATNECQQAQWIHNPPTCKKATTTTTTGMPTSTSAMVLSTPEATTTTTTGMPTSTSTMVLSTPDPSSTSTRWWKILVGVLVPVVVIIAVVVAVVIKKKGSKDKGHFPVPRL